MEHLLLLALLLVGLWEENTHYCHAQDAHGTASADDGVVYNSLELRQVQPLGALPRG